MNYEKNKFEKLRDICQPMRITAGVALIAIAVLTGNNWFYLGTIPLIAGIVNFCPACIISKKCSI